LNRVIYLYKINKLRELFIELVPVVRENKKNRNTKPNSIAFYIS